MLLHTQSVTCQLSPLASSEDLQSTNPSYDNIVSSRIKGTCLLREPSLSTLLGFCFACTLAGHLLAGPLASSEDM